MSDRMSTSDYLAMTEKPKRNKYRNKKVTIDNMIFDSMAEGAYYEMLKMLRDAGEVSYFLRQVPFHLPGRTVYRLDFMVIYVDGRIDHVDIKGSVTAEFKLKRRQVEELYPIKIRCVWKKGEHFVEKRL